MDDWAMDMVREAQKRVAEEEPIASAIREAEDKIYAIEEHVEAMRERLSKVLETSKASQDTAPLVRELQWISRVADSALYELRKV